jgi:hypothetical protein
MLRLTVLVCLALALMLTACVQPTPTPTGAAPTAGSNGYPAVAPTATTDPAAYPPVAPSATPAGYPAPSSRHLAPLYQQSAARPTLR